MNTLLLKKIQGLSHEQHNEIVLKAFASGLLILSSTDIDLMGMLIGVCLCERLESDEKLFQLLQRPDCRQGYLIYLNFIKNFSSHSGFSEVNRNFGADLAKQNLSPQDEMVRRLKMYQERMGFESDFVIDFVEYLIDNR